MYVKTGFYAGNGASPRSVTGVGFQPDFVLIVNNSGDRAAWKNSAMSGTGTQRWDVNFGNDIQSLDSDGFTFLSSLNTNAQNYIWLAIKEAPSNDLAVGKFATNGSAGSVVTSPAFQPNFVLACTETSANVYNVFSGSAFPAGKSQHADSADTLTQGITALNSNGFSYGTDTYINTASSNSDYISLLNETGIFKAGSYTGTGSAMNVTDPGFQADFVIVKDAGTTGHAVVWSSSDSANGYDLINTVSITDGVTGGVANGFSVGTNVRVNTNLDTYFYFAWKNNAIPVYNISLSEGTVPAEVTSPMNVDLIVPQLIQSVKITG